MREEKGAQSHKRLKIMESARTKVLSKSDEKLYFDKESCVNFRELKSALYGKREKRVVNEFSSLAILSQNFS